MPLLLLQPVQPPKGSDAAAVAVVLAKADNAAIIQLRAKRAYMERREMEAIQTLRVRKAQG